MICWHPDIEKCEEMRKLCDSNEGFCYFMIGIHPDNISRTSKTQQELWHLKIDEYSRERSCVALFSGLNITRRDVQSHFAQESMLKCLYNQAKTLDIPLIALIESREEEPRSGCAGSSPEVHTNLSRLIDVLTEAGWGRGNHRDDVRVILYDAVGCCRGDPVLMKYATDNGLFASVSLNEMLNPTSRSGDSSSDTTPDPSVLACLAAIPRERLLLGSNSPHHTPQNIADDVIRSSKNEPSNFKHMIDLLAPYFGIPEAELATLTLENSKRIFNLVSKKDGRICGRKVRGEEVLEEVTVESLHIEKPIPTAENPIDLTEYYLCSKCGSPLFTSDLLIQRHEIAVASIDRESSDNLVSVFTAKAHCNAVYFVSSCAGSNEVVSGKLQVDSELNVSCVSCSAKIGKQQGGIGVSETVACPCGFEFSCTDSVFRLNSLKVRFGALDVGKKKDIVSEECRDNSDSRGGRRQRAGTKDKEDLARMAGKDENPGRSHAKASKKAKSTRKNH